MTLLMNCPVALLKQCFITSLEETDITLMFAFISQQINKMSMEEWMLCKCNHGYCGKSDTSICDIVATKETDGIVIHDHI